MHDQNINPVVNEISELNATVSGQNIGATNDGRDEQDEV